MNENSGAAKRSLTIVAVILSLGLIITAAIVANTWRYVSRSNATITVTGSASKDIKSDYAIWRGMISNEASGMQEAYSRLKNSNDKLKQYLISKGFPADKISTSAINTTTLYVNNEQGYPTNQVTGYRLSQDVSVESNDVDGIDLLSREATELINEGIEITSPTP